MFADVVVLPTPPLPEVTTTTFAKIVPSMEFGPLEPSGNHGATSAWGSPDGSMSQVQACIESGTSRPNFWSAKFRAAPGEGFEALFRRSRTQEARRRSRTK